MLTKYIKLTSIIIFVVSISFFSPVYATTFPIIGGCQSLSSTDMSTQMANEIDSRISGVTASDSTKMLWSTRGNGTTGWARSSTAWVKNGSTPLDFTGASPWNSMAGNYFWAGTLISPRHMIMANHAPIWNGSTIIFVNNSNTVFSYTVVNQMRVGTSDTQVAVLDRDVDSSIAYYPILDVATFQNYWRTFPTTPIIVLNKQDKALVKEISYYSGNFLQYAEPSITNRGNFAEVLGDNDSGNPIFAVVGGQLVLLSTVQSVKQGPFTSLFVSGINSAMTTLGGGYQVSTLDLSCFTPQSQPTFNNNSTTFSIPENSAPGTVVGTVPATGTGSVGYSFTSGNDDNVFAVDNTGKITVNISAPQVINPHYLDHNITPTYTLTLQAQDSPLWYLPTTLHTKTIVVNVTAVNGYTPPTSGGMLIAQTNSGQHNWGSIASSSDGTKLAAVDSGGYIYTSTDSGSTWVAQTTSGQHTWHNITSSSDGTKLAAADASFGYVYVSTDSGLTWIKKTTPQSNNGSQLYALASSSDGTKLVIGFYGSYIYTSTDSGSTWTQRTNAGTALWSSVASSSDGTKLAATANSGGYIYTSTDSGATWIPQINSGQRSWSSITSSSDGTKLAAVTNNYLNKDYIYTSTDGGSTWTQRTNTGTSLWLSITSSSDGMKLVVVDTDNNSNGYLYTSADGGNTWAKQTASGKHNWFPVTSSSDGTKLVAAERNGYLYKYFFGVTPLIVVTNIASLNGSTVTLNGNVTNTGGSVVNTRGFNYGSDINYGSTTTENGTFGTGIFTFNISSLTNGTYHYRAYVTSNTGTVYGDDKTFTVSYIPPTVTTYSAQDITRDSVTFNGSISNLGTDQDGGIVFLRGFQFGLTTDYEVGNYEESSDSFSTESFSVNTNDFTGSLECGTTYHYRAYATNEYDTGYGNDQIFKTANCIVTSTFSSIPDEDSWTLDASVGSIVVASDGTIYVAGNFTTINGVDRNHLASFNSDGTLTNFNPDFNLDTNYINSIVLSHDEKQLYVTGNFITINGVSHNRLASFNTSDGTLTNFNPSLNSNISQIAISPDGNTLYAVGSFSLQYGDDLINNVAAWNISNSNNISLLDYVIGNIDGDIQAIAISPDGNTLYLGGGFENINDNIYERFVSVNSKNFGEIKSFNPSFDDGINKLFLSPNGETLYVNGWFSTVNNDNPRNRFASFNISDGTLTDFDPNLNDEINTVLISPDNSIIFIGGNFQQIGSDDRNYFTSVLSDGTLTDFDPNMDSSVRALAFSPDRSKIYVGGDFNNIGGYEKNFVASFSSLVPVSISIPSISGITPPVTGATPVSSISSTQYTATISWNGNPTTFEPATVYTATIIITPKVGYTLTGIGANFFTVAGATVTNSINSGVITAVFPATNTTSTLTTSLASLINTTSATLNGNITNTGGTNPTARGFNYGSDTNYGTNTTESGSFSAGAYTANISSLTCATTYHYRSYTTNTVGTGYGTDQTFKTSDCPVVHSGGGGGGYYYQPSVPTVPVVAPITTPKTVITDTTNTSTNIALPISVPVSKTIIKTLLPQLSSNTILKQGKTNTAIKTFQQFLNSQGYIIANNGVGSIGHETNYFGLQTKQALIKFQKANKLTPDGILGPKTREVVKSILSKK